MSGDGIRLRKRHISLEKAASTQASAQGLCAQGQGLMGQIQMLVETFLAQPWYVFANIWNSSFQHVFPEGMKSAQITLRPACDKSQNIYSLAWNTWA